jgi:uncharacterized protein (TIGR01244 family)
MMDIRPLTPTYAVSPQIEPGDFAAIRAAGFTTVIDNRPDIEIPPSHHAAAMRAAAEAAGLVFAVVPIAGRDMPPETVVAHRAAIDAAEGPVLAYCASGTRSAIAWSLAQAQAGAMPTDDILAATERGGYQLAPLRPMIEAIAAQG